MTFAINNLTFERNYRLLINKIDCRLHPGECLQISGENGSGKSTLLRILAGYLEPTEGNILWNNIPISKNRDEYQQHMQYLGHQNAIKGMLTVKENINLFCALLSINIDVQHIKNILARLNLSTLLNTPAMNLSAGQLRRLALTRLLLKPSTLWILDEPTTALDKHGQQLFADILKYHLNNNGMVIITSHQPLMNPLTKAIQLGADYV